MRASVRIAAVILIVGASFLPAISAAAPAAGSPAASRFYPLLGYWKGRGQLSEAGQTPVALALRVSCVKAASGFAVHCNLAGRGERLRLTETDLFGVDAVTGQGHWYAITNQGEANDLLTKWTDGKTMRAHCTWMQDGRHMAEEVTFSVPGDGSMTFRSVVTADGKEAGVFSGSLKR